MGPGSSSSLAFRTRVACLQTVQHRVHRPQQFRVTSTAPDPDLSVATRTAIREMVGFLVTEKRLAQREAYQMVSIAGNVAVAQLSGGRSRRGSQ